MWSTKTNLVLPLCDMFRSFHLTKMVSTISVLMQTLIKIFPSKRDILWTLSRRRYVIFLTSSWQTKIKGKFLSTWDINRLQNEFHFAWNILLVPDAKLYVNGLIFNFNRFDRNVTSNWLSFRRKSCKNGLRFEKRPKWNIYVNGLMSNFMAF